MTRKHTIMCLFVLSSLSRLYQPVWLVPEGPAGSGGPAVPTTGQVRGVGGHAGVRRGLRERAGGLRGSGPGACAGARRGPARERAGGLCGSGPAMRGGADQTGGTPLMGALILLLRSDNSVG